MSTQGWSQTQSDFVATLRMGLVAHRVTPPDTAGGLNDDDGQDGALAPSEGKRP